MSAGPWQRGEEVILRPADVTTLLTPDGEVLGYRVPRSVLQSEHSAPDPAKELAILKQLLRDEIDHAALNEHKLDPSGYGWEPDVLVVRASYIEACIEGAEARSALAGGRSGVVVESDETGERSDSAD